MKFALVFFYLHVWQVEAFTATEGMCHQLAQEVREVVENPRPYTCLPVAPEPIYYSR